MDIDRPIDDASTVDEVIYYALNAPLAESDEVRGVLWDHREFVFRELESTSRKEELERRSGTDFLFGPYGILGPYGALSVLIGLVVGYFTLNIVWFVGTACVAFGLLQVAFIRTTPRWDGERIQATAKRPGMAARFAAWAMTQDLDRLEATLIWGLKDSADYFQELVVVVLDADDERAERIVRAVLEDEPSKHPWLWRYAPSEQLLESLPTSGDAAHELGLTQLRAALGEFEKVSTGETRVIAVGPLAENEIMQHHIDICDAPDFGALSVTPHPLALHVLDGWRRAFDVQTVWRADRALRTAIAAQAGIDATPGRSIEEFLDQLLLPLAKDGVPGVRDQFFERRERDMTTQRRVSLEAFDVLGRHTVHEHLLWGMYLGDQLRDTFRVDEELKMVRIDDRPLEWERAATVGVVHPMQLTDARRDAWSLVFADYDLNGFDQLTRRVFDAPAGDIYEVESEIELSVLGRQGWSGRMDEDDFGVRIERIFEWDGTTEKGVIEVLEDHASLAFWTFEGPMSVRLKRPLKDVHPIILNEALYALHLASEW